MSTVEHASGSRPNAASRWLLARRLRGAVKWVGSNGSLRLGVSLLSTMLLGSIVASILLGDPNSQNLSDALAQPATADHLLGTDPLGRDLLAWIAGGIRVGCLISFCVVCIAAAIGVTVGTVAGYFGGWLDTVLMRFTDLQLAVPPLLLFLAVSAVIRPSVLGLIALLSVVSWVPYARIVRTRIQAESTRGYIAAARLAGSRHSRVVARHLFPSALSLAVVIGSLQAGYVLLWESALSFLGLGVQPPTTSLGFMIAAGQTQLARAWWVVVFPGVAIILLVFAFNLIGDGLREKWQVGDINVGVSR